MLVDSANQKPSSTLSQISEFVKFHPLNASVSFAILVCSPTLKETMPSSAASKVVSMIVF
jgi:hypothetical protein